MSTEIEARPAVIEPRNQPLFVEVTPDLVRWAEAFTTAKRSEGLSQRTLAIYAESLRTFTHWAGLRGLATVEAISADDLRTFMLWLAQEGRNAGGQHICYRVLRTWLRWYSVEVEPPNWKSPISKVKPPKLPETPLNPIELSDVAKLLAATGGDRLGVRNRAICLCLIDCGLRANELLQLNLEDFDYANGGLLVKFAKGGKVRTVYAGKTARKAIRAWLRERGNEAGSLFTNETGGRLTYSGLRQIVRRLALRAGIPEPALHSFRRGYALSMLRAGCDVVTLSRLLGHSDLSLLRRYTAQTNDDLRQAAERHSPADRV